MGEKKPCPETFEEFVRWLLRDAQMNDKYGTHDIGGYRGIDKPDDFHTHSKGLPSVIFPNSKFTHRQIVERELFTYFDKDCFEIVIAKDDQTFAVVLKSAIPKPKNDGRRMCGT